MADDPFAERNKGKVEIRKMWRLPQGYPFYGYYLGRPARAGGATVCGMPDELCAND
jgi:hypothetical protein